MYRPHTGFRNSEADKEFIKHIKSNHFEFVGKDTKGQYCTVSMQNFDHKGDASKIRAKLDESKKEDLRRCHFDTGH